MNLWCGVVTLFPEMFRAITDYGITHRAIEKELLALQCFNPRDFAEDNYKTVDDRPYGGGPGMVMSVYPLKAAIQAARKAAADLATTAASQSSTDKLVQSVQPGQRAKVIYVSPQGKPLDQAAVQRLSDSRQLILVAGRYEGIDERLIELEIDEEWSLGDYVLSGGELAVMAIIDALTRLLPGALGHAASASNDSFVNGLLDFPHYTRPPSIDGLAVPEVLLSGDHVEIARWRLKQSLGRTYLRRRDLIEKFNLSPNTQKLLQEFLNEHKISSEF